MAKAKTTTANEPGPPKITRPASSPKAWEDRVLTLAMDVVEEQLRNRTISSAVLAAIIKRASTRERLEEEILEKQKELITAKTESLQSGKRVEELYAEAMAAMRRYSGKDDDYEDEN